MRRLVPGGEEDTGIASDEENEKIPVNQDVAYTEAKGKGGETDEDRLQKSTIWFLWQIFKGFCLNFLGAIFIWVPQNLEWFRWRLQPCQRLFSTLDEDNKIANNIMSNLFKHDLDEHLQKIFLCLDPLSLKAGRQVCKQWDDFIKRRVWGSKSGSLPYKSLMRRLDYHWRHAKPNARTASVGERNQRIGSISCDNSVIVCGMFYAYALVKVFDVATLGLLTDLDTREDDKVAWVDIEVDIGKEVICAVTDGGGISVWRRSGWSLLYKQQRVDVSFYGVRVINNYIITSGRYNFQSNQLAVFKCDGQQVAPMARLAKSEDVVLSEMCNIDSDGVWILAGTGSRLTLWKLESYKEVKSLYTSDKIGSLSLLYPFGLTVGAAEGVNLWDLEKGEIMRNFGNGHYGQVHNNGKFFGWFPIDESVADMEENSMLLYNIEEIINAKVSPENLWSRRKNFRSSNSTGGRFVSFALNTSCLVTVRNKKLRVWDFWNCDQFKDTHNPGLINDPISEDEDSGDDDDDTDDFLF